MKHHDYYLFFQCEEEVQFWRKQRNGEMQRLHQPTGHRHGRTCCLVCKNMTTRQGANQPQHVHLAGRYHAKEMKKLESRSNELQKKIDCYDRAMRLDSVGYKLQVCEVLLCHLPSLTDTCTIPLLEKFEFLDKVTRLQVNMEHLLPLTVLKKVEFLEKVVRLQVEMEEQLFLLDRRDDSTTTTTTTTTAKLPHSQEVLVGGGEATTTTQVTTTSTSNNNTNNNDNNNTNNNNNNNNNNDDNEAGGLLLVLQLVSYFIASH